jgi:hypothetical protein
MNEKSREGTHADRSLDVASTTDPSSKTSSTGQALVHKHTLRVARLVSAENESLLREHLGAEQTPEVPDATGGTRDGLAFDPHLCATEEPPAQRSDADVPPLADISTKGQVYNSSQRRLWYHARSIRKRQRLLRQARARRTRVRHIWWSVLGALLVLGVSNAVGISLRYYQSVLPRLQDLVNRQIEQSTRIYDRSSTIPARDAARRSAMHSFQAFCKMRRSRPRIRPSGPTPGSMSTRSFVQRWSTWWPGRSSLEPVR